MEGFLTLAQAARQLDVSLEYLQEEIQAGRVVAIVREGESWLSPGEVSRLGKAAAPAPKIEADRPQNEASEPEAVTLMSVPSAAPRPAPTTASPTPPPSQAQAAVSPTPPPSQARAGASPMPPPSQAQAGASPTPPPSHAQAGASLTPPPSQAQAGASLTPPPSQAQAGVSPSVPTPPPATPSLQPAPVEDPDSELRRRYEALARQFAELEKINQRLKIGLQETEATLRRNRTAKANLESDIINLQEQLKRTQTRATALEREVQHLTHQLERAEEKHSSELRKLRAHERTIDGAAANPSEPAYSQEEISVLRRQMEEKDRIISQEYQERAVLRSQLEERSQKYFELKARYEKEKSEWSEILARELQTHGMLKSQLEELKPKNQRGWNPFRREK